MEQKPQREPGGKVGQSHGSQSSVKPGGTVGRDVPDESKEHHTEIAVEAGRKGGEHRDKKD
jgi:hypothetical protein